MNTSTIRTCAASVFTAGAMLGLLAAPAIASENIKKRDMLRYCQGEAAGEFGFSPRDIEMNKLVEKPNGATIALGRYSRDSDVTDFRCRFSPKGEFRFVKTTGGSSHDHTAATEPSSAQIRACNAVEDRYGEVEEFSGLKPGAFEIILKYDDGSYVCDVEADGKVTYYEKLR